MNDRQALVQLTLVPGLGPVSIRRLLDALGPPEAVFKAPAAALQEILGQQARPGMVEGIRKAAGGAQAAKELEWARELDVQILTWFDGDYPGLLRAIHDPPPVLYVKGELLPEDAMSVAMVGTRRATPYGLQAARELARELAKAGLTVVSGLAEGIDGASHEGALEAPGRTIAVLGHGLNTLYPAHHARLAERITASGALVSEFPLEEGPQPGYFPRRNRIISGLSLGVVVVEAPESSGALITASAALEQGREVFAVPGPITSFQSAGSHRLIQEGAKLTRRAEDILEELAPQLTAQLNEISNRPPAAAPRLSRQEEAVYQAVPVGGGIAAEELAKATATPPENLLPVLTGLELKGLVRQIPGRGFSRPR
ncbi:MAG: DNA-protecting protein DprA [Candidatus Omnitrophica bacterium]|nr:DNA-protecting protein DprA [Candidatus Omnitrophota bacterium]